MATFQVDLRGMVDLLARNLYSGPRVYVRELLQNAVDAIAARAHDEPDCPRRVTLTLDGPRLTCHDTGIGLDEEEMRTFLSTIGASSKRDELGLERVGYLGQFGIGLLSCFMVSEEITVASRSARAPDAPTVGWRGSTDGTYAVLPPGEDVPALDAPGTTVVLNARPGESWVEPGTVRALVDEFGSLLPVRIEVRSPGATTYHGREPAPWEMSRHEAREWCRTHLGVTPFDLVDLDVPAAGLRGLAVIMPTASPTQQAHHTVSVKRMLVSRSAQKLTPEWAYFARVVADARHLRLTASRETLVDDELLGATREAIGTAVRGWLERLRHTAPTRMEEFVRSHAVGLCAVAVHDPMMLDLVAHHVPLETTEGPRSLTALADLVRLGRQVRYTRTVDQYRALADVASAQGIVLVDAGHSYEEELLQAVRTHSEVLGGVVFDLVDPGELLDVLEPCTPAEEAQAADLLLVASRALGSQGCQVVLRRFAPAALPALYLPDPDLAGQQVARSGAEAARTVGSVWSDLLGVADPFATSSPPRLVLNRSNPLVARLVTSVDEVVLTQVLRGLYVQSLLSGHQVLGPTERAWAAQTLHTLLERAVGPGGRGDEQEPPPPAAC